MSTTPDASQSYYPPNVLHNSSLINVKFISACFAGAVAGILGLQNWLGFALFIFSTLFSAVCMSSINCDHRPNKFVPGGFAELLNPGQDNAFTFLLVWTLFYGIVHVYD
ncbi:hypothetical protein HGRIS_010326 [Hohenbuehelia grisea]|uniref:ER membrane protein complex subunit 6 n=1 Tax=Hohenbuehelia grisea TaxID=104357 RepID=A0ABR3J3Y6_9AGAR